MIKTANISDEIVDLTKELTMVDNVNLPFSSLLLNKGTQKVGSVICNWQLENLDDGKDLALEGAEITDFKDSTRTTDKNICQIISKAVNVSGTANSVVVENIADLFTHEINNRIVEAKRDLEHYLVNGKYTEESGTTPRQMKGLIEFATKDNTINKTTAPKIEDLSELTKKMRQAGTASQDLVLLADYNMTDILNTLFEDKQRYINVQNEFGSVVNHVNLTYGGADVYTIDSMPQDTIMLVNMDFLQLAELRPLHYQELAQTGDSKKGFIVMENTLKVLNPNAITLYKKTA